MTRRLLELSALAATTVGHYFFQHVWGLGPLFIGLAVVGWGAYIVRQARRDPAVISRWGLGPEGFVPSALVLGSLTLVCLGAMAAFGWWMDQLRLDWLFWLMMLTYPLYGLIQQLLLQGLMVSNLKDLGLGHAVVVVGAAALFGAVHYPIWQLCVATFFLGLVFTPVFLRWRNLWPLACAHGWLGAAFYLWVMAKDPLEQLPWL
jgi:uncharacterized protein